VHTRQGQHLGAVNARVSHGLSISNKEKDGHTQVEKLAIAFISASSAVGLHVS